MGRVPADAPERRRIRARTALGLSRRVCRSTHPATHMTEVRHRPTGTVVIPCFNQARFLPAAVASVHRQSYRGLECIVVNDGSTHDTADVASRLGVRTFDQS